MHYHKKINNQGYYHLYLAEKKNFKKKYHKSIRCESEL